MKNIDYRDVLRIIEAEDPRKHFSSTYTYDYHAAKRSSELLAARCGVSARTIERLRTVLDHGTEEIILAVKDGKMSTSAAEKRALKLYKLEQNTETLLEGKEPSTVYEVLFAYLCMGAPLRVCCRSPLSEEERELCAMLFRKLHDASFLSDDELHKLYKGVRWNVPVLGADKANEDAVKAQSGVVMTQSGAAMA